jgi:hypothetical protein
VTPKPLLKLLKTANWVYSNYLNGISNIAGLILFQLINGLPLPPTMDFSV